MIGDLVPDDYDQALMTKALEVAVVGREIVLSGGPMALVLDAAAALETGRRLMLAAGKLQTH